MLNTASNHSLFPEDVNVFKGPYHVLNTIQLSPIEETCNWVYPYGPEMMWKYGKMT